jgi:hypothetical protein
LRAQPQVKSMKEFSPRSGRQINNIHLCRPLRGLTTFIGVRSLGCARKASLHPRLYAQRPLRGLNYAEDQAQQNYAGSTRQRIRTQQNYAGSGEIQKERVNADGHNVFSA